VVKLIVAVVLAGALAAGGAAVMRDKALSAELVKRATALLDGVLGVKPPERPARAAREPAPREPPRPKISPAPPSPRPEFVDRAPVPSALEKVEAADRRRLDDIIARRLGRPPAAGH
jgi:hypothetical protein